MLTNVLSLEVYKQKQILLSMLIILGIALAAGLAQALLCRADSTDVMLAVLTVVFAAAFALPVAALVLAASAARGLRSDLRRSAEEMLPFSPRLRLFGAYVVSLVLFVLLAGVLLIPFPFLGGFFLVPASFMALLALGILFLHLLAFTLTYWTGKAVLGAGLACVCAAFTSLCIQSYTILHIRPPFYESREDPKALVITALIVCYAAAFTAMLALARPVECTEKLRFKAPAAGFALLCAPLLGFGAVLHQVHIANTSLHPMVSFWSALDEDDLWYSDPGEGALFTTPSGSVLRVLRNGARQVPYRAPNVEPFKMQPFSALIVDLIVDRGGSAWILLQPDMQKSWSIWEIRSGPPGEKMETYTTFSSQKVRPRRWMFLRGNLSICGDSGEREEAWCSPLPPRGKIPQWTRVPITESRGLYPSLREVKLAEAAQAGLAATLSPDRTVLSLKKPDGTEIHWQLPGKASWKSNYQSLTYVAPVGADASLFVVPVLAAGKKLKLVICDPDGTVRDPWNRTWNTELLSGHTMPGGSVWRFGSWREPGELLVVDRSGRAYSPVSVSLLYDQAGIPIPDGKREYPRILSLRMQDAHLWMILQGILVDVDLEHGSMSRKVASLTDTPTWWINDTVYTRALPEGVYFLKHGRILLVDWNGAVKDLGKAEIRDD